MKYLQFLKDHPTADSFTNKGISDAEIRHLEELYNNSRSFPVALKELLSLAGNFCHALDYNIYDSQEELQTEEREELKDLYDLTIERPFFFIDLVSYGLPVFVFLDEGDDPPVNQMVNNPTKEKYYERVGGTLQSYVISRIRYYQKWYPDHKKN
ncbi:hypothetical protein [Chryseobacterium indologenes]|uniref:SMI1/KNR4 family protein n=1 Tax=Chryseobacterium indologenes TaxID=253 RepID=A0A0N0ITZ4_CHRID|nr:hypothetical protein [Chryseobacterium indologenes]KPE49183.1 hypothetical protein AOB46_21425 [Chryseobacterium indologenes]